MDRLLLLAHIGAIATYLGSSVFLAGLIEVVGRGIESPMERRARWVEVFPAYNILSIGALGVAVMTGAWLLTPLKQQLGQAYFDSVGRPLAAKLALAFSVILAGTWISFGMCHRMVRAHQFETPVSSVELDRLRTRLRAGLWLVCTLTAATIWYALGMHGTR
jgi:hypothetical protein